MYQLSREPVPLYSSGGLDTPPANLAFQASLSVSSAEVLLCLPQSLQSTACSAPAVCCRWGEPPVIPHSHRKKALPPPCSGGFKQGDGACQSWLTSQAWLCLGPEPSSPQPPGPKSPPWRLGGGKLSLTSCCVPRLSCSQHVIALCLGFPN